MERKYKANVDRREHTFFLRLIQHKCRLMKMPELVLKSILFLAGVTVFALGLLLQVVMVLLLASSRSI